MREFRRRALLRRIGGWESDVWEFDVISLIVYLMFAIQGTGNGPAGWREMTPGYICDSKYPETAHNACLFQYSAIGAGKILVRWILRFALHFLPFPPWSR